MKSLFSCTYPISPAVPDADFAVTESEDGTLGVTTSGMWIRIPEDAFQPLYDLLRKRPEVIAAIPAVKDHKEVRQLVIAAREVWEDATDSEALQRLDKALEPFSEAVPYANEPEQDRATKPDPANPIGPDDWHCGNSKLQQQFAMAMMVAKDAPMHDLDDLEYLAMQCGPTFTRDAITRLLPRAHVQQDLDDEIPW